MKFISSTLTFTFLLIVLSCSDIGSDIEQLNIGDVMVPMPPPNMVYNNPLDPSGSTPLPSTLKVTSSVALENDLKSAVNIIKSNPSNYWATLDNGIRYTNFTASWWPTQAKYMKHVHVSEPPADYVPLSEVEFKAYVNTELPKLGLSLEFSTYVNRTMNYVYSLDGPVQSRSFAQFKAYIQGQMSGLIPNTKLAELERFVIMQMLNGLLVQVQYTINNPTPTSTTGGRTNESCLPQTKEEWKAVAESAFTAGVAGGLSLGLAGVRAGAIATTAAGNPIAGGIVGGAIGFVAGFLGGAVVGGGAKVMFECAWNKLAGAKMMVYQCSGRTIHSWAASPPVGCTHGADITYTSLSEVPHALKLSMTSIYDYGIVHMPGRVYLHSLNDNINSLLKYLNQ
jgi:hypothetical protein